MADRAAATAAEVEAQADAWRSSLAEVAVTRRDVGLLRRVEAGIAAGIAVAERSGYAEAPSR